MNSSEFISVYDAAQRLGCSCRTVQRLVRRGVLPGTTLPQGKKKWLRRDKVEDLLTIMRGKARRDAKGEAARRELFQLWLNLN